MANKGLYVPLKVAIAAIMVALLLGCFPTPYPNLLYQKNNEVWVMADDGTLKTQLSPLSAVPKWAPQGTKNLIAFQKIQNGYWAIFTMDNQGKNLQQLTDYVCGENYSWSPDRNWIVYENHQNGNWDIYKIKADGTSPTRLTTNPLEDRFPDWSPNGNQIAYSADLGTKKDIFVMDTNGNNAKNVTNIPANYVALQPVWSPKGDKILFLGNPSYIYSSGHERLYLVNPQQAGSWQEISKIDGVSSFLFTPSADYILYRGSRETGAALYKQGTDSPNQTPEILSTFDLGYGSMAVNETEVFFAKQLSSASPSPMDGLYSLTWRWKGTSSFHETLLEHAGSNPDY